ncbi:pheromone-binding protein-related protein 6-like isoform X2 [Contarinia nasturtii]|uniref:pheromone-binding protein-related protein 6-like isoform X2 n=1 Tax=Contarinia nasturtii TaxID=265458 RepID=UPI0012D4705B|nr:pheromone-binding protein-related protein 6-like isoform X2 [Contarinia nasturtii]
MTNKSKHFIMCFLFAATAMAVEVRRDEKWPPKMLLQWFLPAAKECKERTGVSEEAIKEFDSGEIHDDAALKCYMYCVFEVLELINDQGQLFIMKLADHIESNYDEEVQNIAFQMGRKCLRPEGENNCEKAFWYHKCWKTRDPVHYFLI